MKKLLFALTLVLCLAISMVAFTSCGGNGEGDGENCEHTWADSATTDKAPTCTEEGSASIKCTACGEKKADSVTTIAKIAHEYETDSYNAPSCTTDGSETKVCANCGDSTTTTIPATGDHIWQANASVDFLPSCENDGQKSIKCIKCQQIKEGTIVVVPASHEWQAEATVDTAPTETTRGQKSIKCLNCGRAKAGSVVVIPAYGETYEFPVSSLEGIDGGIISFKNNDCMDSKFVTDNGKLHALIDLSALDAAYNYVTITKAAGALGFDYAFLQEELCDGDRPYYAEGFFGVVERRYDDTVTVHIPDDAAYIYVVYSVDEDSYLPGSVVFSYADFTNPGDCITDETLDSYEYPMESIVMGEGSIYDTNNVYKVKDTQNGYFRVAFIDLTDVAFNTIRMGTSFTVKNVLYTFLTEIPEIGDTISYATGYTGTKMSYPFEEDFVQGNYEFTVAIPADAKCLVIYYVDFWFYNNFPDYWGPSYIVFENGEGGESGGESGGNTDPNPNPNPGTPDPNPSVREPLDYLQDATLDEYEYPMDKVVGTDGAIIYWDEKDADQNPVKGNNVYHTNFNNNGTGFYKNAFIEITDTTFNYVYIVSNGVKKAGWAFISDMPEVGEAADYVGVFETFQKFSWTVDTNAMKIAIPEGAKYLVIYYEEDGASYKPASITFTKEAEVTDTNAYNYPMDTIEPIDGYINHSDNAAANNGKYHYLRHKADNERYAFIDLTDLDYNTVTLTGPANGEATNFAFLSKMPTENSELINYAIGYNDCIWYSFGCGSITLSIPENATCLAILYNYSDQTVTCPQSIVFSNRDNTPSEMLKNDTLESYEYPMYAINPSMGTISSQDNTYIRNFRWVNALVNIEDTVFDKVVFEINAKYGKICYGFLTDYPTVGEEVSFVEGTGMTTVTNANGSTVTVDIPEGAKILVVYWQDWNDSTKAPIYYIPESVTFIKDTTAGGNGDASEDAGNTGNGGASEDAEENAGGNGGASEDASDSEDAA